MNETGRCFPFILGWVASAMIDLSAGRHIFSQSALFAPMAFPSDRKGGKGSRLVCICKIITRSVSFAKFHAHGRAWFRQSAEIGLFSGKLRKKSFSQHNNQLHKNSEFFKSRPLGLFLGKNIEIGDAAGNIDKGSHQLFPWELNLHCPTL